MSECIFCQIVNGKITANKVYEDKKILAFHDVNPKATKHILVVPKKHIESLQTLTEKEDQCIGQLTRSLPKIAEMVGLDQGFRTVINTGKGGGQEIYHLHYHILGGNKIPGF